VEYYECQLELQQELSKSYTQAERIVGKGICFCLLSKLNHNKLIRATEEVIGLLLLITADHRTEEKEIEYFVKWDNLSYAEATWESGKLIAKRNPEVIKIYKRREASDRTPAKSKSSRSRPKFSQLKNQPDHMKGDDRVS